MIETFSDLAKLLDDGWRITGIRADSDGDTQRFRFEVEARRIPPEDDFRALLVRLRETTAQVPWRGELFSTTEILRAIQDARQPAITPEGWEIGSGFAEFLHSVGHGNLDTELRDLDAR